MVMPAALSTEDGEECSAAAAVAAKHRPSMFPAVGELSAVLLVMTSARDEMKKGVNQRETTESEKKRTKNTVDYRNAEKKETRERNTTK